VALTYQGLTGCGADFRLRVGIDAVGEAARRSCSLCQKAIRSARTVRRDNASPESPQDTLAAKVLSPTYVR
jgi:hypothetical protein